MLALTINLEGDGAWLDLRDRMDDVIHLGTGSPPIQVSGLKAGMASGRPSVAIRLDLPDGKVVIAETSLALFLGAASALHTKFGGSNGHHD